MAILLNQLFNLTNEEICNSKIEFNMQAGSGGSTFIDQWLVSSEADKLAGTCKECSFWGWYGNQRNYLPNQWAFSFVRLKSDEWLFISAARIIDVPEKSWARTEILTRFAPFFGRLIIKCSKGDTFARYVFHLNKYLNTAVVKEILPCLYSGEKFEGYDKVNLSYKTLKNIFSGKILPTYYEALQKVTGVYCLTDTFNGKHYIGSATGLDGIAQRWTNYLDSKHGGNKKLVKLYNEKGDAYFEQYFTFTLLEYFSLSYDSLKILEREQYWKKCLDTIKNGYNDN